MWSYDDGQGRVFVREPGESKEPTETLEQEIARLRRVLEPPTFHPLLSRIMRAIFTR